MSAAAYGASMPHDRSFGNVVRDSAKYSRAAQQLAVDQLSSGDIVASKKKIVYPITPVTIGYYLCDQAVSVDSPFDLFIGRNRYFTPESDAIAFRVPEPILTLVAIIVNPVPSNGTFALPPIPQVYDEQAAAWVDVPGRIMENSDASVSPGNFKALVVGYQLDVPIPRNERFRVRLHADAAADIEFPEQAAYDYIVYANISHL